MKFIKLSLLVLPFFVLADNPLSPVDIDSNEKSTTANQTQIETRSAQVAEYETSGSYTSDESGVEEVVVTGIRRSLEDAISIKRNNV